MALKLYSSTSGQRHHRQVKQLLKLAAGKGAQHDDSGVQYLRLPREQRKLPLMGGTLDLDKHRIYKEC